VRTYPKTHLSHAKGRFSALFLPLGVMLAVPPAILDMLHLRAGATVGVAVDGGRLVVEPNPRPRYTLDELLAQCDETAELRVLLPEPGPPVMIWKSGQSTIARAFRFCIERAFTAPLPERQHIAGIFIARFRRQF
jgi:antitoxin component of MazEF toxin-antitoxin module